MTVTASAKRTRDGLFFNRAFLAAVSKADFLDDWKNKNVHLVSGHCRQNRNTTSHKVDIEGTLGLDSHTATTMKTSPFRLKNKMKLPLA